MRAVVSAWCILWLEVNRYILSNGTSIRLTLVRYALLRFSFSPRFKFEIGEAALQQYSQLLTAYMQAQHDTGTGVAVGRGAGMVAAGERAKFSELVRCFVMHRCFSFLPSTFPSAYARCLDYIHDAALLNTTLPILFSFLRGSSACT